ncbi:MAG: metallophosphoesterase family protein [Bacteroidota bacterium]
MKQIKLILSILLCFQLQSLFAQIDNIHLSFKDGTQSSRTMAVSWTSITSCSSILKYGLDRNNLKSVAAVDPIPVSGQKKSFAYKATLENLLPGHTYYYQCEQTCANSTSEVYAFKTPPKVGDKGKICIGVWGDTQNNEGNKTFEVTKTIVDQLLKQPLNFTIHTGDIVENGSVAASWNGFLHTAQPLNAKTPFMPATGNHDVINDNQNVNFQRPFPIFHDLFNLPNDNLNYAYDYGNTHFIAINSGYCAGAAKIDAVLFKPGSAEYKWLEKDLIQAKKNKKIKWIILYDHYPMHAHGVSLVPQWQNQITPLIDKYAIDLVLSGHRHVYERHKAMRGTTILDQPDLHIYDKPMGTVFITNGSAGGSLQGVGGKDMPSMLYTSPQKMYTYALMTIAGKELSYEVYDINGNKIDYFKMIK